MREITVDASLDQVRPVTDFVNGTLADAGCPDRIRIQIDVAIDEIFSNIARYAYPREGGSVKVRVDTEGDPLQVIIAFVDQGVPCNPLAIEIPDTTALPADERPVGGLGLMLVRKTMDDIAYDFRDGQNILTIRRKIGNGETQQDHKEEQ